MTRQQGDMVIMLLAGILFVGICFSAYVIISVEAARYRMNQAYAEFDRGMQQIGEEFERDMQQLSEDIERPAIRSRPVR